MLRLIVITEGRAGVYISIQRKTTSLLKRHPIAEYRAFIALVMWWNCCYLSRVAHDRISELLRRLIIYLVLIFFNQFFMSSAQCNHILMVAWAWRATTKNDFTFIWNGDSDTCVIFVHRLRNLLSHHLIVKSSSSRSCASHVWCDGYLTMNWFESILLRWLLLTRAHQLCPLSSPSLKRSHAMCDLDFRIATSHIKGINRCVAPWVSKLEIIFSKWNLIMNWVTIWMHVTISLFWNPHVWHVSHQRINSHGIFDSIAKIVDMREFRLL